MADDATRIEQLEAELRRVHEAHAAEVAGLREQQTATSEVLRVIAGAPTDLRLVLQAVAESVDRLCYTDGTVIHHREGDVITALAATGRAAGRIALGGPRPLTRQTADSAVIREGRTIHILDARDRAFLDEFPDDSQRGNRTTLLVPLRRQGRTIGCIVTARLDVSPFTEQQIALVEAFADQAVIA